MDNSKNTLNKIDIKQIIEFIKKNVRYFSAGALFVALLVVLVFFTGNKPENGEEVVSGTEVVTEIETETASKEVESEAVNELIKNYYAAYAAGDIDTLLTMASPVSENEQAYITLYSQYVEEYQNQIYYVKKGLDENSYVVNVYLEVKFAGVDTVAPGLDMFYVRTNEDGNLYIDNLYSQYNMRLNESALDTSVNDLIKKYTSDEEFLTMIAEVQQKYEDAIAADENLATMANVTIPEAISAWAATITQQATEEQTSEEQTTEEATEIEENNSDENAADEENADKEEDSDKEENADAEEEQAEAVSEKVKTLDKVNIREKADQDSERIGQAEKGETFTRIGTEGDWSIIEYDGKKGYIKSEYLTTDISSEEEEDESTTASNGFPEGTEIRLENTTNIRSAMDENSDKVGVAYPGETVTVIMSYAEGWTKVEWDDETGYVKTELLQQ